MRYGVDPEQGLAEMADLWRAETAEDLHRVLVLHQPIRRSADTFEPSQLLAKHHETEPDTSIVTAVLLLTDRRWSKGAGQLVRQIAESGMLDDAELDLLAQTFVSADEAVYWEMPDDWFGEGSVEIILDTETGPGTETNADGSDEDGPADGSPGESEGPVVAKREVFPPLRRWAAERLVRNEPATWGGLLKRARDLGGRDGSAVMSGLLDGAERLPAPARDLLAKVAIEWSDQAVRLLGFRLLVEQQGPQAAYDRAHRDPSARVRSWADTLLDASTATGDDDHEEPPTLF